MISPTRARLASSVAMAMMGVLVILAGIYGPGLWHLLVALGVAWLVAGFNAAVATTDFEHLDHSSQRQRERRALFLALAPFLLFDVAFHPSFDDRLGPLESAPEAASHSSHRPSSRLRDVATTIWSIVLGVAIFKAGRVHLGEASSSSSCSRLSPSCASIWVAVSLPGFVRARAPRRPTLLCSSCVVPGKGRHWRSVHP